MIVIDQSALSAVLTSPLGRQHTVEFFMECVIDCPAVAGIDQTDAISYRAWFLYDRAPLITRIESRNDLGWLADHMPRAATELLQSMIAKALREQQAIDSTSDEDELVDVIDERTRVLEHV